MIDNSTSLFKIGMHIKFSDENNITFNKILCGFKLFLLSNDLQENKWISETKVIYISLERTSIAIAVIDIPPQLKKSKEH